MTQANIQLTTVDENSYLDKIKRMDSIHIFIQNISLFLELKSENAEIKLKWRAKEEMVMELMNQIQTESENSRRIKNDNSKFQRG